MDLPGCEMAYEQSILLLEALLSLPNNEQVSVGDDTNPDNNGRDGRDGSGNEEMTDEDRGLIENLVANLYARAEHVRTSMK